MSKKRIKVVEEVINNEDLLLQVFLCLPAKSLIRFKCVSKQWLSVISDPKFCTKYTRLNPSSPILGIYYVYKIGFLSYHQLNRWSGLKSVSLHQGNRKDLPTFTYIKNGFSGSDSMVPKIMYSCNGLFLCSYSLERPYLVCNFTTKKIVVLPQHLLTASGYHNDDSAFLSFDPLKSPDYKVVLFNVSMSRHDMNLHHEDEYKGKTGDCSGGGCYEIDVYSSNTGVWKRFYFRAQHSLLGVHYMAVCNGALHCITFDKFHGRFEIDTTKLIFNPLPPKPKGLDMHKVRYFGESCGHLFLICIPWCTTEMFNVLELDTHNSIWTMKYHVHMSPLIASLPDSFERATKNGPVIKRWNISIICVVKEDEVNGFALLLAMPGKIVSYNLNNKKFRVIGETPIQEYPLYNDYYTNTQSFPFMANMSPI